jgi:hypothetical protein
MDHDDDKTFTATINKLSRQFQLVATPENIREAFIRAGSSYSTGAIPYVLEFSRERMMESAGFRQAWQLGVPLESLSTPRQNAQFMGIWKKTLLSPGMN